MMYRDWNGYNYDIFLVKIYFSLIRVLCCKSKKLSLTFLYYIGQKTWLEDSWKLLYIDQSRFYNFFSRGEIQKWLMQLWNTLPFSKISHLQAEWCIEQGIFLHVIPVRIIVPWFNAEGKKFNPTTTNIRVLSFNYSFIGNMFAFPFFLEKRLLEKMGDYLTQISEIKKAKADISKSYFWHDVSNWNCRA